MTPNEERSADLDWMAQHYEIPKEAARRLGLSLSGLRTWCKRHDPDVLARLDANEERRKGYRRAS